MMGRRSNDKSNKSEIIGTSASSEGMTTTGPNSVQELATQIGQSDESNKKQFEVFEKKIKKLESRNGTLEKLVKEQAERMGRMEGQMKQLEKEKKALEEQVGEHDTMEQEQNDEMDELNKRVAELEKKVGVSKSVEKPAEKVIKRECHVDLEQWQHREKDKPGSGKAAQKRRVEGGQQEQEQNVAKQRKIQEKEQKMVAMTEYANLVGENLELNYKKEKMLLLIQHGNGICPELYIQQNQHLDDRELLQSIVDLMASTENPKKMIGKVTIEFGTCYFKWPQNAQLKLKKNKWNVPIKWNGASARSETFPGCSLAEYELANKDSRFKVFHYYWYEERFGKYVCKFVYQRMA